MKCTVGVYCLIEQLPIHFEIGLFKVVTTSTANTDTLEANFRNVNLRLDSSVGHHHHLRLTQPAKQKIAKHIKKNPPEGVKVYGTSILHI